MICAIVSCEQTMANCSRGTRSDRAAPLFSERSRGSSELYKTSVMHVDPAE